MSKWNIVSRIRQFYGVSEDTQELKWTRSKIYKRRLEQVKTGWIISGLCMLAAQNPAVVLALFMFSGFLSLAFLEKD